jgi:phospholipid/cholesterol/gamma-HCH transport system substrate-binding protein
MKKQKIHSIKLGLMVATGLMLFIVAIYYLGSQQNLFSSTVTLKSYFRNVSGLVEGNKVRYSGITVGTVSQIKIIKDTTILVEMAVDKKIQKFIRKDSKVVISNDGLMGSKIINIMPGTSNSRPVTEDDFLQTKTAVNMQNVLEDATQLIRESRQITKNLLDVSQKMNNGNGDFAALLNENAITSKLNKTGDELLTFASNAKEISENVNNGNGDLGRLVKDTIITGQINNVMRNLNKITLGTDSLTTQLLLFTKELNTGNGIAHRLVYDTIMADQIDTTFVKVNNGLDDIQNAAKTIEHSWIFNLFSKKQRKEKNN